MNSTSSDSPSRGAASLKAGPRQNGLKPSEDLSTVEKMRIMRKDGWPVELLTGRVVRVRSVDPAAMLRRGDCPDILTPLLIKSLYASNRYQVAKAFLDKEQPGIEEALAYVDVIDQIVVAALADETELADLDLDEKKLIFQFAMSASHGLVNFRQQPEEPAPPVADLAQGDDLSQAAL